MVDYEKNAKLLKVLSDPNRMKIIDILSCGERCICDMQEFFDLTQPTLSHHMKVLMDVGLVTMRKNSQWNYYSLNDSKCDGVVAVLSELFNETEDCICKKYLRKGDFCV